MNAQNCINELQAALNEFERMAKEYGKIDENEGIEIYFCNGYAVLRAEVEDEYEETIVCKQEIELNKEVISLYFTAE